MFPNGPVSGRRHRSARFRPALLALAAVSILSPATAAIDIRLSGARPMLVTLSVQGEPLAKVLDALAREAHFDLEIDGELGPDTGNWRFTNRPLPAVLQSLTQGRGLSVFYADTGPDRGAIIEVHVYGAQDGGGRRGSPTRSVQRAPAPPAEPAAAAPDGVDDSADRRAVLVSLTGQSDPASLDMIAGYMRNDPDSLIRRRAIDMLVGQAKEDLFQWLDPCLSDTDPAVRRHCVNAISRLDSPEVFGAMSQILYGDEDRDVRAAAVRALAAQRDSQAGTLLEAAVADPGMGVQTEAAQALTQWRAAHDDGDGTPAAEAQVQ